MLSLAHVTVHASQFPEKVHRDLLSSLRSRQINHKFHYDSIKQARKWLALHEAYAPSRRDPECAGCYEKAFLAAAGQLETAQAYVIGLGCGGGQKEARLLALLRQSLKKIAYTPSDVSLAMVLTARLAAFEAAGEHDCFPLVCDLAFTEDLMQVISQISKPAFNGSRADSAPRIITCFGLLPNFEPQVLISRLAAVVRPADTLLLSANLAPGPDYSEGTKRILPLYDNTLTRDWLLTFLLDLGIERQDGVATFAVEEDTSGTGLKRVTAHFEFVRSRQIGVESENFDFQAGDTIRLFFSYRHTVATLRFLLASQGMEIKAQWITRSEEEGVFLIRRR